MAHIDHRFVVGTAYQWCMYGSPQGGACDTHLATLLTEIDCDTLCCIALAGMNAGLCLMPFTHEYGHQIFRLFIRDSFQG